MICMGNPSVPFAHSSRPCGGSQRNHHKAACLAAARKENGLAAIWMVERGAGGDALWEDASDVLCEGGTPAVNCMGSRQ